MKYGNTDSGHITRHMFPYFILARVLYSTVFVSSATINSKSTKKTSSMHISNIRNNGASEKMGNKMTTQLGGARVHDTLGSSRWQDHLGFLKVVQ
jgi:hypothetical protein